MPRVLYFTSILLPLTETFVAEQARHLERYKPVMFGVVREEGHPISDLDSQTLADPSQKWRIRFAMAFPVALLERKIAALAPDIIHAHFGPNGALIAGVAKKLGIPLVVTFHGYDLMTLREPGYRGLHWAQYKLRMKNLQQSMSAAICVSKYMRRLALHAGFASASTRVHYLGTEISTSPPNDIKRRSGIVFAGRMVSKKAPDVLLESIKILRHSGIEDEFTFVGGGELLDEIKARSASLSKVNFTGPLPWEQAKNLMSGAGIFCLPSRAEGLGQVLLEAQTLGVPVVTTKGSGAEETMIDGKTGLLAEAGSAISLADCLAKLLQPEMNSAFSESAVRHVAENFDIRKQSQKLEALYDEVIAKHRSDSGAP